MKVARGIFSFTIISALFVSFTPIGKNVFKELDVVKLEENIYIDAKEISLLSWMEYMQWNLKKYGSNTETFKATIPKDALNKVFILKEDKFVLSDPEVRNKPVTNLSYAQVQSFCGWRSERIKDKFGESVNCRLLSKVELDKYKNMLIGNEKKNKQGISNSIELHEMLAEEGAAFGEVKTGSVVSIVELSYTEPSEMLGFRCVLEPVE